MRIGWSEVGGDKPVSKAGSTELGSGFRCVSQVDEHRIEVLLREIPIKPEKSTPLAPTVL